MTLLQLHAAATTMMAGLAWFVQVVHYPLLARVGRGGFPAYARFHARRTGRIVAPLMLVEAATAVAIAWRPPPGVGSAASVTGLVLVGFLWISTWTVQVPLHRSLQQAFSPTCVRALVTSNWLRTAAWTARAAIALGMLAQTHVR
jgi:hypothetical protein